MALQACSRKPTPKQWHIDRITVSETTLSDHPSLGIKVEELRAALRRAFEASSRFVPSVDVARVEAKGVRPFHCRFEIVFTKESQGSGDGGLPGEQTRAEVGVSLELRRAVSPVRYQAAGMGRAAFGGEEPGARARAFRLALDEALAQVIEAQVLQLSAEEKDEAALLEDLKQRDPRVRDYAVRVLAERRNVAAVPALIERLSDTNQEVWMRAAGALRAIGDPRAVPALIELTQGKDAQVVVALIGVIAGIGGNDAEAFLFTLASGHPDEQVREVAQKAQDDMRARDAGAAAHEGRTP